MFRRALLSQCLPRLAQPCLSPAFRAARSSLCLPRPTPSILHQIPARTFHASHPTSVTMNQAMKRKKKKVRRTVLTRSPLLKKCPQKKGVCTAVYTASPKKPNSGKRKVARVKLSSGDVLQAYIQGEGHNLQEHSVVMIRGGRAQDLPGVLYKVVRGSMDTGSVVNRRTGRSRYGAKKPKN